MHEISIPQSVIDRVIARRGRAHVFDDLVPSRTALVVVDMQNAFLLPEIGHSFCAEAPGIIPNINRLAGALREAGGVVVWIQTEFTDTIEQDWSVAAQMSGPARTARRAAALRAGTRGHALADGLEVRPHDLFVTKTRFSAFIQGSSDLEQVLRDRNIDTVIVTGTVTNVCCESTARDAMMRDFRVVFVSDANAANSDAEHNASLVAIYLTFGDVMSTEQTIECMRRNAQRAAE